MLVLVIGIIIIIMHTALHITYISSTVITCYLRRRNNTWVNDGRGGYDRVSHGLDDEEIEFKARMIDNVEV